MVREEREAQEQRREVGDGDPLMSEVRHELKAGEPELVARDHQEARQRDPHGAVVKQRHPHEDRDEQEKVDRDPRDAGPVGAGRSQRLREEQEQHGCLLWLWTARLGRSGVEVELLLEEFLTN